MNTWKRSLLHYGVALVAVTAALAAFAVPGLGKGAGSLLFLAVLISAWYGGVRAGLFATLLTTACAVFMLMAAGDDFPPWRVIGIILFVAGGILISLLVEALHVARRRTEASQRWLAAVLNGIGDAVIATDNSGRVTFTNPIARMLTGWEDEQAKKRTLGEIFRTVPERQITSLAESASRLPGDHEAVPSSESMILIDRSGFERPIEASASPIRNERGEVFGVVVVFHDLTERKRVEDELRNADRRKDEFLAMLAHELRNPLSAISNAVQLAKRGGWETRQTWTQEVLERQVHNLSRLIDDLLDVSRVSRGKIQLRETVVDLGVVLDDAVQTVRPLIEERRHAIEVAYPTHGLHLRGDATRLEQIVVNLLNNAAKYTESGGRIELSAARENEFLVVRVRDTGVGIAADQVGRMFDLFTQGDRSLARSEGGLGIGLTLVRTLTEMHGGSVTAQSGGHGCGSEFTVRLPAIDVLVESLGRVVAPQIEDRVGTYRILVVDDNVDTARTMSRLLKTLGHDTRTANDGPSAIEVARDYRPQYILLDIGLPLIDGYEVARRLRAEGHDAATIIAVSGYGRDEDRLRSKNAGIDHHLVKPVDHDALLALMQHAR